ncbi:MAG: Tol-Pal system protein TolB, partial [Pseudomonadota bacterium]
MGRHLIRTLGLAFGLAIAALPALAQSDRGPLRITITDGIIEPLPVAIPMFVPETPEAADLARDISALVSANLTGSGLFTEVPREAHIGRITTFDAPVAYTDWSAINADALITGSAGRTSDGRIVVKFRLHDVFAQRELGAGQQFVGTVDDWRRMAHKVS